MYLAIKTDQAEAALALYEGKELVAEHRWQAHRSLSDTLNKSIDELLAKQKLSLDDLTGLVVFEGPGSFTGLRIGHTVANALAYSLSIPVVTTQGDNWLEFGLSRLAKGDDDKVALPHYGGEANITKPRK